MLHILLITVVVLLVLILLYRFLQTIDCDLTLYFYDKFFSSLKPLSDKVIWITGASSGIGEHLAYQLAENIPCKLVLSGTNIQRLQNVKDHCLTLTKHLQSNDILLVPFDISKIQEHLPAFQTVFDHFHTIDVLINNAGKSQRAEFHQIDLSVDRMLFDINVFGLINLTRMVVQHWYDNEIEGSIMVTSSTAGKLSPPFSASYNASKHALHGYFECLRIEGLEKKLHITMACPGPVFSNVIQNAFTERPGEVVGRTHDPNSNRMQTSRCARLMLSGFVNRLDELWISNQPVLSLYYACQYAPSLSRKLWPVLFSNKKMQKLRDGE